MNEVIERDAPPAGQNTAVATTEAVSFIQMIERASRDPAVDIDKMERLMQMHERMLNRQAQAAFDAAFAEMQTELPQMPERGKIKNKAGGTQSTYALWEDINDILKPILSKHGFSLSFKISNRDKFSVVTGTLAHSAGHRETSTFELPVDISGSKNEVQGLGSSTSYGKRYVAGALLNLTSRGEDNDGAGGKGISAEDKAAWLGQIEACETLGQTESLWADIAKATAAAGDVPTHEELHAAMALRRRALRGAK